MMLSLSSVGWRRYCWLHGRSIISSGSIRLCWWRCIVSNFLIDVVSLAFSPFSGRGHIERERVLVWIGTDGGGRSLRLVASIWFG